MWNIMEKGKSAVEGISLRAQVQSLRLSCARFHLPVCFDSVGQIGAIVVFGTRLLFKLFWEWDLLYSAVEAVALGATLKIVHLIVWSPCYFHFRFRVRLNTFFGRRSHTGLAILRSMIRLSSSMWLGLACYFRSFCTHR